MTQSALIEEAKASVESLRKSDDRIHQSRDLLIATINGAIKTLDDEHLKVVGVVVEAMLEFGIAWAAEPGLRQLLRNSQKSGISDIEEATRVLLQKVIEAKKIPNVEFVQGMRSLIREDGDASVQLEKVVRKSIEWGGKALTLETGRIARQADGAVLAAYGDTVVLCAVTAAKGVKEGQDFFPLTVHYQEKFSAAGRIPGGFFKRERGATEKETLTSRLIDRPIRPLFPEGFYNEINVICQVLSYDGETEPDVVAMIATSAALTISGVPFMGPIGACRVGYEEGEYTLNPAQSVAAEGALDLIVAATGNAVMMVESEAKELSEEVMLGAVMFAHDEIKKVVGAIVDLAEQAAKEPWDIAVSDNTAIKDKLAGVVGGDIAAAYKLTDKSARSDALNAVRAKAKEAFAGEDGQTQMTAGKLVKKLEADIVRTAILKDGQRIDGRRLDEVRQIDAMVGFLPRTHGSALFTRGETQAICTTTLGTKDSEQMIDGLEGLSYSNFMLHYNFPPYSVGEVGRFGAPGRREIGHGKLAWRALHPVLPSHEDFPYTIRILSDITESNGSSSMATICGGCLSMMDAGVPIERPVSGIAMGLILDGDEFAVLSDILGDEDHLGDMDFKVVGTENGITTMQMDIKVAGITKEIMSKALEQAKAGRAHILGEMAKALTGARTEVSKHAPRIETMQIDKSKIRDVIGTGGKVIREIVAETGAKVDIDDEGVIKISSSSLEEIEAARRWIEGIVEEAEVGKIYNGKVVNIVDFGAFVNFMGGKDGLVHVSEMKNERVEKPTDVVSEGMEVKVKVLEIDNRGKVRMSMRVVDQETGEELEDTRPPREPRKERGLRRAELGRGMRSGSGKLKSKTGRTRAETSPSDATSAAEAEAEAAEEAFGDFFEMPEFLKDS